jgi:hypothetical protein
MVKLKNSLKDKNVMLKSVQEETETRHKKLRETFRHTKHELEECFKLQSEQHTELEAARDRINVRIYCIQISGKLKPNHFQSQSQGSYISSEQLTLLILDTSMSLLNLSS